MHYLKNIVKAAVSLGLLGYLVYQADPQKIWDVIAQVGRSHGLWYVISAFLFEVAAILLMALRWKKLLSGYGHTIGFQRLSGFYLIGLFFNNFLPTSIGGDVVRIYKVAEETDDRTSAFASVIIERMLGIAATLSLAITALFFISQQFHSTRMMIVSIVLFIGIALFFVFMLQNWSFKILLRLFSYFTVFNIGEKINKLFEAIHYFKKRRRILLFVFLYSLGSQIAIILMNYSLALAFNVVLDIRYLFMVIPVTFVLTMLPSINGVGLRDLGFVSLLGRVGVSSPAALSLSFMNLLIPMILSVGGAVLFVIQKRKSKTGGFDVLETNF